MTPPEDIAIVGMAAIFPGAPNVQQFWENILSKVSAGLHFDDFQWFGLAVFQPMSGFSRDIG